MLLNKPDSLYRVNSGAFGASTPMRNQINRGPILNQSVARPPPQTESKPIVTKTQPSPLARNGIITSK